MASSGVVLLGFGSVSQKLSKILTQRAPQIYSTIGKQINVVGVSDSKGAIYNKNGIDLEQLLKMKESGSSVTEYNASETNVYKDCFELLKANNGYEMFVDASAGNADKGGYPGLQCAQTALENEKKVVLANKVPLVMKFKELHKYADNLRYSATVCSGLPVVNLIKHDLMLPYLNTATEIKGIFNSTTNYILSEITDGVDDDSVTMESALKEAQRVGIAEADSTGDLNGSDAANKLCIIMNILGYDVAFEDIEKSGLELLNKEMIKKALKDEDKVYKMLARAVMSDNGWKLSVSCEKVPRDSMIGMSKNKDVCIQVESELFEEQFFRTDARTVLGTSSAVFRDMISLYMNDSNYHYLRIQ